MSLPSYATFYDSNNVSIGSCFVNCGWFLTFGSLVHVISRDVVTSEQYKNPSTSSIRIYGYTIPKELIEDCSGKSFNDVEHVFEQYFKSLGIGYL